MTSRDIDEPHTEILPASVLCDLGPLPDTTEPLTGRTRFVCITDNVTHYDFDPVDLFDDATWLLVDETPVFDSKEIKNAA